MARGTEVKQPVIASPWSHPTKKIDQRAYVLLATYWCKLLVERCIRNHKSAAQVRYIRMYLCTSQVDAWNSPGKELWFVPHSQNSTICPYYRHLLHNTIWMEYLREYSTNPDPGIITTFRPTNKLCQFLVHPKDQVPKLDKCQLHFVYPV